MNSEKECVSTANIDKCTVVLLDVAGTTTSLAFVKETLFTFAADQAQTFLKDNWEDEEVKKAVKLLQEGDKELDVDGAVEVLKKLTGNNSDNKGLKTLQGLIYKKGYADKTLKALVFSDVPKAFENWSKERKVAIYSTGSIESQKLLFTHSTEGDLSQYISNYFDQSVGLKTESGSYKKIAEELKVKTEEILFINDNIEELKAAKDAGLLSVLIKREGNEEVPEEASKDLTVISSFTDLSLDNSNKRKNEEETDGTEEPPTKIAKKDEQDASCSTESSAEAKEKPEAVAEKPETIEDKTKVEDKSEPVEKMIEKPEIKEQPIEEAKPKQDVEPMEVDAPEIETIAEDNKVDSTTENDSSNGTSKEVAKEGNDVEAMETEQPTENAAPKVKTEELPVVDKTDDEKLAEQADKKEAMTSDKKSEKLAEKETIETDKKTEEPDPKKDVEVDSTENGKENAVEIVEVEVLEKKEESTNKSENVKTPEEVMEIVKDKEQIAEIVQDSTEVAKKSTENNKDEEMKLATETIESKTVEGNKPEKVICEVNEVSKETKKEEIKEPKQTVEPAKEEKLSTESSITNSTSETSKECKNHMDTDNVTIEPKEPKPAEVGKSSEETKDLSKTTITECSEETKPVAEENCSDETKKPSVSNETKEPTVADETKKSAVGEKSSEEIKEPMVVEKSEETKEPVVVKKSNEETKEPMVVEKSNEETKEAIVEEKCSGEKKDEQSTETEKCPEETKEAKVEDKVEESKIEVANNDNNVSETVANELKDNKEETVKAQENTSENKIGNGSCELKITEDVTKNGKVTNGQENGDEKNEETDPEETDIKIKKLETNAGSPAVSVEV